jgi:ADP-heptose:LPS heptosyltransferase
VKILLQLTTKKLRGDNPGVNPKNYPMRPQLLDMLAKAGHTCLELDSVRPLAEVRKMVEEADAIICIDSFLQHLCWYMGKKAIVIFGQSDPEIFGHKENINVLKGKKYLREKQHWLWEQTSRNDDAFVKPSEIIRYLGRI